MKLDKFKLHTEDEQSFTISHPSGKVLKVSKSGLSPEAHKMIQAMREEPVKAADGVDTDTDDDSDEETPSKTPTGSDQIEAINNSLALTHPYDPNKPTIKDMMGFRGMTQQGAMPVAPPPAGSTFGQMAQMGEGARQEMQADTTAAANQPDASVGRAPATTQADMAQYGTSGIDRQMKALREQASAAGTAGQQSAEAIQQQQEEIAKYTKDPAQLFQEYQDQDKQLMQAYQSKSIDPDRYWHNMSTGSKIVAALGMIVSGAGAGVRGQSNMAYDILNKGVERDIEAQKMDQSQSMNLWKMNREAYNSEAAANIATRTQMYTGLQYKLQQIAQSNIAPQAKAQADFAIGQLQMQKDLWNRQMVLHQALQGNVGNNTEQEYLQSLNTAAVVNPTLYKEARNQYVPGVGIAQGPIDEKDRGTFQTLDNLDKIATRLQNFTVSPQGGRVINPFGSAAQEAEGLRTEAIAEYKQLVGLGRLSPEIMAMFEKSIKNPGSWNQVQAQQSFKDMKTAIRDARSTEMQKVGIKTFNQPMLAQPKVRK